MEVIRVENVSKLYDLGQVGTGTVSKDLNRWWASVRGKEDPYAKIGQTNDRTKKAGKDDSVWALHDINFSVKQGEVVGIIGRNGAGKSTLLKIISRITTPTTGAVKIKGRIASLLEVGTGFHPEMTGRENIFMNGTLLGMTRREVQSKLDEIIDFAGVALYIDTPVKRYSSGMQVRLAFAVAAFLEPEILIVDEVLAVGDAEFQKKAIGRMQEVSKQDGRTVLFVSHNLGAVATLCKTGLVLSNGSVVFNGSVSKGLDYYLQIGSVNSKASYFNMEPKENDILSVKILNTENQISNSFYFNQEIRIEFTIKAEDEFKDAFLSFRIKDQKERNVFTSQVQLRPFMKEENHKIFTATIPSKTLVPNVYTPVIALHVPNKEIISFLEKEVKFEIEETGTDFYQYNGKDYGCVFIDCEWK